jgi:molybdopterin molybdotransferase
MNNTSSCNDAFEQDAISVAEAVECILSKTQSVAQINKLHIREALNRVVSRDILSPQDVPAHDNSAMDGYAVASDSLPLSESMKYKVVGTAYAGRPFDGLCGDGECVRIMTGAMMPAHTDSIVIQEQVTVLDSGYVEINPGHRKHQNVRFSGEDIKQGAAVFSKGHKISAADLGVLASLGIAECCVFRKPRVSFFSTGDELRSIGETLNKGDIYDSNRYSLYGLLSGCHVDIIDMGVIKDDPVAIKQALLDAAGCSDMVLTSGGVSVGEADYIKDILVDIGRMDFFKIAMKPGRPLTSGEINDCLFFGLPGNPVAVMVTFYQFVLPSLVKLSGMTYERPLSFKAECQSKIRKSPGRCEFQRAVASVGEDGNLKVKLTGKQGSGILTSMSMANCFIVLPEDRGSIQEGDEVTVEFFRGYYP